MATDDSATGEEMVRFLRRLGTQGRMNSSTANAYASSVEKILSIEEGWEALNIVALDAEDHFERFTRLHRDDYTQGSLATFKTRWTKGIELYLAHIADPVGWKMPKPERPKKRGVRTASDSVPDTPAPAFEALADEEPAPRSTRRFAFNLRSDLMAYVDLPTDLTRTEAKRLSAFIGTLVIDDLEQVP